MIFWAVLIILWRPLLSAAVQTEHHAKMQYALDSGAVKGHQKLTLQVVFLELSQEGLCLGCFLAFCLCFSLAIVGSNDCI